MKNSNSQYSDMILRRSEDNLSRRIIIDLTLLSTVAITIPLFYAELFRPYQRGFFCDDETIRYPYKESTITDCEFYVGGVATGILAICLCEFVRKQCVKPEDEKEFHIFGRIVPSSIVYLYSSSSIFLFGASIVELATDFIKFTLGRLRPNFIAVCEPDFNCSLADPHTFVVDYICTNPDTYDVDDARKSFPSAHASFTTYAAIFSVIYLHKCFICRYSKLLTPELQFILMLIAGYTAISRITDNKHHWSDIVAGIILGVIIAVLMFCIPETNSIPKDKTVEKKELQS